jgi:glutaredoxin 3
MEPDVRIYTTPSCPYCIRARTLLKKRGIAYEEIDVAGDAAKRAWLVEATGGRRTVPQIFIKGEPIGGFDELSQLDASGALQAKLA